MATHDIGSDRIRPSTPDRDTVTPSALRASRVRKIQERIEQAFYERPTVAERIAERLLISGDLDLPS